MWNFKLLIFFHVDNKSLHKQIQRERICHLNPPSPWARHWWVLLITFIHSFRWALKYGNPILASGVVLSSTFTLSYYRKKLKLGNYGQLTLFLPIVLIPSLMNQVYHNTVSTLQSLKNINYVSWLLKLTSIAYRKLQKE